MNVQPRLRFPLVAMPLLAACVNISDEEHSRRLLEASSIGAYEGTLIVTFRKSSLSLPCEGEVSFSVEAGAVSGAPLPLSGEASCDTEDALDVFGVGLVQVSGELNGQVLDGVVDASFDGEAGGGDGFHHAWSGEIQLSDPVKLLGDYDGTIDLGVVNDIEVDGKIEAVQIAGLQ